ncbi:hypothetical protein BS50DRAFT_609566 [Corynespora cassiicola Philippines]|uniref:AAA+ ATPase domain-containing protein n=1 Tax=Corynespora cassiicola Philippines TaxID=1448308 RepID=A0A2T2NQA4_CORCC|nr:hypothetical protein BS50DRAFT_609566 [Corynespora cassiicola Philippines]
MLAGRPFSKPPSPIGPTRSSSVRSSSTQDSDEAEHSKLSLSRENDEDPQEDQQHIELKNSEEDSASEDQSEKEDHSQGEDPSQGEDHSKGEDHSQGKDQEQLPEYIWQTVQIKPAAEQESRQREVEETVDSYLDITKALTISRDQTEASNFKNERLRAIDEKVDKVFEAITEEGSPWAHSVSQEDIRLQLALLEQQNKKRLLIARAKQSALEMSNHPERPLRTSRFLNTGLSSYGGSNTMSNPWLESVSDTEPNAMATSDFLAPSRSAALGISSETNRHEMLPRLTQPEVDALASQYGVLNESELISKLLERIQLLANRNPPAFQEERKPRKPRSQVLHLIESNHTTVCLQEPTWTFGKNSNLELRPELPLIDLDDYLRKNEDIYFVINRSYRAPQMKKSDVAANLEAGVMPNPQPFSEDIHIISEDLRLAFENFIRSIFEVGKTKAYAPFDKIRAPYMFWYDYRSTRQAPFTSNVKHQIHLKLLFDWIEANYAERYNQFDQMISRGNISYNFVDYVFNTGDVVVSRGQGKTKAYRLHGMPALEKITHRNHHTQTFEKPAHKISKEPKNVESDDLWAWNVPCWSIRYDGHFFRQNTNLQLKLRVKNPEDEVPLTELNFLPIRHVEKSLEKQLFRRGTTFWSCRVKKLISYRGDEEGTLDTNGERYMIDNESYKRLHAEAQKSKRKQDYSHLYNGPENEMMMIYMEEMSNSEPPTAPEIYLFPPMIAGFSLRRKRWIDLEVDNITEVLWNKKAFDHLVADDKTKELVQALMADRISNHQNTDLIHGKGNGLIILLHGSPGTGKTFTAESVAEMAEKPLYPVSCGDIGTEPEEVEKYLESVLYLGNRWDCVVLLDEADVFLEERGIADLARNALVSVFLRVLEYYDGILILTSNRVGTFDEAFKSRISLSLHYPNFNEEQRCRIWKNFLNRLRDIKEQNVDFDDINQNLEKLAKEELNGRQIRNAITIGRQLAKFRGENLNYKHLAHVVDVAGQFEKYVKETKENLSHDQIARLGGIR